MNQIFKTIWSQTRQCFVVADECQRAHTKRTGGATVKQTAATRAGSAFKPASRISLITASTALALGLPVGSFAAVDTGAWASETGVTTETVGSVLPFAGSKVGYIDSWNGSWSSYNSKTLINITAAGGYDLGVYGSVNDEFWGDAYDLGVLGDTGRFRQYAVINAGSMVEQPTWTSYADPDNPSEENQVGGVYWIAKFANSGTVAINDLRSEILVNTSANFSAKSVAIRAGGVLENSGTMTIAGPLYVGVTKDTVFDSNSMESNGKATYNPDLDTNADFDTANNAASVTNSGTLSATAARVAGTVTNTGNITITNKLQVGATTTNTAGTITAGTVVMGNVTNTGSISATGSSDNTMGAVENSGSINLGSGGGTLASLNQTTAAATTDTTGSLSITGALTNKGKVGNSGKPTNLTVGGDTQNQATGLIKAVAGAFATVTNYGSIIIDNLLSATGLIDNKADASISAGTLNTKGITNAGSLATTGSGNSTIDGNLTNTKTVTLGSGTTTVTGNVSNSVAAATIDSTGALTISGTLDNSGKIGNTNAPTTLSVTGKTTNAANALVKAGAASLGAVENHGTVAVTGALSAGATTNSGTMTAASADLSSTLGNTGDITITNAVTVAGATTNSKNITAKSGTFADVANASPGVISLTNDSTMASISANSGHIEVSSGKLTVTNGAVQTDGEIVADSAQMSSLTNLGENGSSVEVAKTLTVTGATDNKAKSTIEAGNLVLAGTTNAGTITSTAATGTNTFGATENSGAIDLASSGTFASLNQTAAAATLDTTSSVAVTGTLTNKGKIGNTKTPSSLAVGGAVDNQAGGIIKTGSADFGSTLANAGTITATGAMSVDGKTTNASTGAITAATFTLGETENAGSITGTGTADNTFGATTNSGSIDLGTAKGTFASLNQSATTSTLDTTGAVAVTGAITNKGKIGNSKTPSSLTAGGAVDNQTDASIKAGSGSFASTLDNAGSIAITNSLAVTDATTNALGGSITAGKFTLDDVTNAGTITGTGTAAHTFGDTENSGTIDLATASVTLDSLNQTASTALFDTTGAVTVNGALTNKGKIGNTKTPSSITATGATDNQASGLIKAGAATIAALTNAGTMTITGAMSASGAAVNSGTASASSMTFGNTLNNTGTLTATGAISVTGNTTNSKTITAASGTFADVANTAPGTISLTSDSTMASISSNTGAITVSNGKLTVTGAASLSGAGTINAKSGQVGTTLTANGTSSVTITNGLTVSGKTTAASGASITAGTFSLAGVENAGSITGTGTAANTFGATVNSGSIDLATAKGTFASLNQNAAAATLDTTGVVEITGALTNQGKIGNTKKPSSISVGAATDNKSGGVIKAGAGTFAAVTNAGTIVIDGTLAASGTLTNSGTITAATANLSGANGTNSGSISVTNLNITAGSLNSTGTLTATNASVSSGANLTLGASGTANISALSVTGSATNAANNTVIGTLSGSGSFTNGGTLTNLSHIGTTTGMSYTQTAGTIRASDNSWFSGATLTINGGTIDRTVAGANTLGTNTVTISGPATSYTDKAKLAANWKDGKTYVHVGVLDSNATVTVNTGGILEADSLNLTSNSLTLNGGALATSLSNFFTTVSEAVYQVTDGAVAYLTTDVLGAQSVSGLNADILDKITFGANGAALVITDTYVSTAAIASASLALANAAGEGKETAVVYTGTITDSGAENRNFYKSTFDALKTEQGEGSKFTTPGVVFAGMTYINKQDSESAAKSKMVVGTAGEDADTFYLDRSIGFKNVLGTDDVTVANGYTFVLTGGTESGELLNSAAGAVTVTGANSTFKLGSAGVASTVGHLGSVTVASTAAFKVDNGTYTLGTLTGTSGTVNVSSSGVLTVDAMTDTANSAITNAGELTITSAPVINSAITNSGTMEVDSDTTLNGAVSNSSALNMQGANIVGAFTNTSTGTVKFNDAVTIDSGLTGYSGKLVQNDGRFVSYGAVTVDGAMRTGTGSSTMIQNALNVTSGGKLNLQSDTLAKSMTLAGTTQLTQGQSLFIDGNMTVSATGRIILRAKSDGTNGAALAVRSFTSTGAVALNNGASLSIGDLAIESEAAQTKISAIKGSDWRLTFGLMSSRLMARPGLMLMSVFRPTVTGDINGRIYDIDKTDGFASTTPTLTITADSSYSGTSDNKTYRLGSTTVAAGATLTSTDNAYVLAGDTYTTLAGSTSDFRDTELSSGQRYSNLIVKGAVSYGGIAYNDNLVIADNGSLAVTASGNSTGQFLLVTDDATVDVAGVLGFDKTDIDEDAVVTNNGIMTGTAVNVTGKLLGTGSIANANAEVTVEDGATLSQNTASVKTLTNKGNTTLASVSTFGSNSTYEQSGTAASLSITDGAWFSGTNLIFSDGAQVAAADLDANGELGANTVTIKGGADPVITAGEPNTATFAGLTTVEVNTLRAETNVDIQAGGRLIVGSLDAAGVNATLNGGVIDLSSSDLLVASTDFEVLELEAQSSDDTVDVSSGVITNPLGLLFNHDALNGLTLNSGTVSVVSNTGAMRLSTLNLIANNLGNSVTTVYNGTVDSTTTSDSFSVAEISSLFTEQEGVPGSAVTGAGVLLSEYDLQGTGGEVAFSDTGDIDGSIGFRSVKNATGIVIDDGNMVTLSGNAKTENQALDYTDTTTKLTGTVNVVDGSFVMGSDGTMQENIGWIESAQVDGELTAKNGLWGVKDAVSGSGDVTVEQTATLEAGKLSLSGSGSLDVQGDMTLTGTEGSSLGSGYTATVSGSLDASNAAFTNAGDMTLSGTAEYDDLTVATGGSNTVAANGYEKGDTLIVEVGATETVEQNAKSEWATVQVHGTADVAEDVDWTNTSIAAGGVMTATDSFAISSGESLANAGTFDATGVAGGIVVSGTMETLAGGVSHYGDMTLQAGSSNTVRSGGSELCGTLTIEANATQNVEQNAVSQWAAVNIYGTANVASDVDWTATTVYGTGLLTVTDDFAISAGETLSVAGTYNATAIADLQSAGSVTIQSGGVATYQDMTLASGAANTVENGGSETGAWLKVASGATQTVETGATSIWNKVTVNGTANVSENVNWTATEIAAGGAMTATGSFTVDSGETITNAGTFDATGIASMTSAGSFETAAGGTSNFANLTLNNGADHRVASGGSESGSILTVGAGSAYTAAGTASWDKLALNGGTIKVSDGTGVVELVETSFSSGTLSVEKGVFATNGASASAARSATTKNAVFATGGTLEVNEARIIVGDATGQTVNAGDVFFGADSALVIDTSRIADGGAALKGSGTLTVKNGSELVIANATWGKHVLAADGLSTEGMEDGAWEGANLVNQTGDSVRIARRAKSLTLVVGSDTNGNIEALDSRYVATGTINGLIADDDNIALRDVNSPYADVSFIERMLDKTYMGTGSDGKLDVNTSVTRLNSALGITAASGIDAYALEQAFGQMGRIDRHMSSVTIAPQTETALWVEAIGEKSKTTNLDFGSGKAGYKASTKGIVLGADVVRSDSGMAGIAFHYGDGNLDSKGSATHTDTDAKTYGFTLYAAKDFGKARLSAQAGYGITKGDMSQNFHDVQGNAYGIKAKAKDKIFTLGLKGEYAFEAGSFEVAPHAGVRFAHTRRTDSDISINGKKAFRTKGSSTTTVQAPIGVAIKGQIQTEKGWIVKPYADLSVIPQFGDKKAKASVSAVNYAGTGEYKYDVSGSFVGNLDLGIEATNGAHSLGVVYSGAKGNSGKQSHGLTAKYKFVF